MKIKKEQLETFAKLATIGTLSVDAQRICEDCESVGKLLPKSTHALAVFLEILADEIQEVTPTLIDMED